MRVLVRAWHSLLLEDVRGVHGDRGDACYHGGGLVEAVVHIHCELVVASDEGRLRRVIRNCSVARLPEPYLGASSLKDPPRKSLVESTRTKVEAHWVFQVAWIRSLPENFRLSPRHHVTGRG